MLFVAEGARGRIFSRPTTPDGIDANGTRFSGEAAAKDSLGRQPLLKAPGEYFRGQTRPDRIDANGQRFSGEAAAKDSLGRQPGASPRDLVTKAPRTEGAFQFRQGPWYE